MDPAAAKVAKFSGQGHAALASKQPSQTRPQQQPDDQRLV